MKKIFLGSLTLFLFGMAVTIAQMSCQKLNAQQERPTSPTSTGKILFSKLVLYRMQPAATHTVTTTDSLGNTTTQVITDRNPFPIYNVDYYICDLDGSNPQLVPISLPAGLYHPFGSAHLANNSSSIVFQVQSDVVYNSDGTVTPVNLAGQGIYSCNIDGTNLMLAVPSNNNTISSSNTLNDAN